MEKSFSLNVGKFAKKTKLKLDTVVRKVCFDLYTKVKRKTPVDTGYARANWMVGINQIPTGLNLQVPPSGSKSIKGFRTEVIQSPPPPPALMSIKAGTIVYIVNNVPYIVPLEHGHSKTQAPNGMVKVSVLEVMNELDTLAKVL